MSKITKAQLVAQNYELRAEIDMLRADLARLRRPATPALDALGVERDERGCYVRRTSYASFRDALAASRAAAMTLGTSVRVL